MPNIPRHFALRRRPRIYLPSQVSTPSLRALSRTRLVLERWSQFHLEQLGIPVLLRLRILAALRVFPLNLEVSMALRRAHARLILFPIIS